MAANSTHAHWRYTCTLCHLGNLDTHHLKEHIAVTHLKMVKYRCSQCSLEVFTSDAMIHHRTECTGTYTELPALIGMNALDEFQRLCDETIQREMNRKIEALRYFGSHLMAALQFNKENSTQSIGQQTSSQALNVSTSAVSTKDSSTNHNNTQSFDNNTADTSLKTPNLSVLSLNKDNSNSLSFASLNTSELEPGEVVTPMKSKDSQGLMNTSFDERRRERSDSRDQRDRRSFRKSYHHNLSLDCQPSHRRSPYRRHGSSSRSSRSPSRLSHSFQSSRSSPPLMKVQEEAFKPKDEATIRKENTFLTKHMVNQKEKIEQEILAKETKETGMNRIISREVHSVMNPAFNESSMFGEDPTTWSNSNETMDVGRSFLAKNRLPEHGSSNGFDRWKNVVFFEQCKSGFLGMPPPSTRQQFGFGGYPMGFGGNYRGPPPMQPSPLPPQWQMPTEDVGYSAGVCPFHPRNVGHRVTLCGRQIADLGQRMQVFRAGGGCQDFRCLKRHKDSCRSSTFCLRCQEPHHPLFCRLGGGPS